MSSGGRLGTHTSSSFCFTRHLMRMCNLVLSIEFDNLHVDFGREFFSGVFTKDSLDLKKFALAKRYACLFSADRVCQARSACIPQRMKSSIIMVDNYSSYVIYIQHRILNKTTIFIISRFSYSHQEAEARGLDLENGQEQEATISWSLPGEHSGEHSDEPTERLPEESRNCFLSKRFLNPKSD